MRDRRSQSSFLYLGYRNEIAIAKLVSRARITELTVRLVCVPARCTFCSTTPLLHAVKGECAPLREFRAKFPGFFGAFGFVLHKHLFSVFHTSAACCPSVRFIKWPRNRLFSTNVHGYTGIPTRRELWSLQLDRRDWYV